MAPPPAPFNLARHCLADAAERLPNKTALIVAADGSGAAAERWTFCEIENAVLRIAGGLLRLGLKRGDRVLIRLGNTSEFPLFFFGAIAAGLVAIPTSTLLTAGETSRLVADSGAKLIVARDPALLPDEFHGARVLMTAGIDLVEHGDAADYADTLVGDPAFLVFTSGTSGHPKGVLHAQRTVLGRQPMIAGWYGLGEQDRLLHAGAFNWTYTLGAGLMDPWSIGATAIVYSGEKDATIWARLIVAHGATLFAAVPSVYRQMLKYSELGDDPFPDLRHGLTAGEALPAALLDEWRTRTGKPLYEAFGMSEISTYISSSPLAPVKPGSPGRPQAGRRVAILPLEGDTQALAPGEVGVIAVHNSDPGLMLGYWNQPEETAAAFRGDWFVTGDHGLMDDDGYVWFSGRGDDMMNTFGYRVAPQEVEAVLAAHPDVAEAAVTDIRVDDMVRIIAAFVVPKPGASLTDEALGRWCAGRLADYKRPRRFIHISGLPRTASGKLRRRDLREFTG